MNNPRLTYDSAELVLKQNATRLIWIVAIPTVGLFVIGYNYTDILTSLKKHPLPGIFIIGLLLFVTICMWFKIFDWGIKLVINRDGIWSKKYGLIQWSNIFSYRIETSYWGTTIKTRQSLLKLDTQNPGRLISLELTYFGADVYKVEQAIKLNSSGYSIQQL